jgi:hypothetical protein
VSDFVEECRREWKRLRVPTSSADEMAADLSADLREAERDGAVPEDVLGTGAMDPRAFAAAWAEERGLVRQPWWQRLQGRHAWLRGVPLAGLFCLAALAAVAWLVWHGGTGKPFNTATPSKNGATAFANGRITGTAILACELSPAGVRLKPDQEGGEIGIHQPPRSLTAVIRNSGNVTLGEVVLIMRVGKHSYLRRIHKLPGAYTRKVSISLPRNLPARFTVSLRTRPVPNERNMTNNYSVWRIKVTT